MPAQESIKKNYLLVLYSLLFVHLDFKGDNILKTYFINFFIGDKMYFPKLNARNITLFTHWASNFACLFLFHEQFYFLALWKLGKC